MAGQAIKTCSTKHIKDVPEDYPKIESASGEALPTEVLILPIHINGEVGGALELASFRPFEEYQLRYLERACASIAAAFYSIKSTMKTVKLFEEAKEYAEMLQHQETEMRASMSELRVTQDMLAKQKDTLEFHNRKIIQSIQYAERIQSSILPSKIFRKTLFPESFLIYRPKDIVSGDFFWLSEMEGKKLAAVIDCTGHGVPGALMSIVGNNVLTNIIKHQGIYYPATILELLNIGIRKGLNQDSGKNNDGMDLGICLFEKEESGRTKMTYAGAKHKLFVWRNEKLEEFKSDRLSIGGGEDKVKRFTNQIISLEASDTVYMTTDGFLDQANMERRSFSQRRFKALIEAHHDAPVEEQKVLFGSALDQHQGSTEQRDDITVIAIKV